MVKFDAEIFQAAIEKSDAETLAARFLAFGYGAPKILWSPTDADLPQPDLKFIFEHWNKLRGDQPMPHYRLIDAAELGPVLGFLALLQPIDGGRDFQLRVYGSHIADRSGVEMTGKRVTELPTNPIQIAFVLAGHRAVLRRRETLLAEHETPPESNASSWTRLILPFGGDDGAVHRIMALNHPGALRERAPGRRDRLYHNLID